jgi:FtsP/CotA-like multicopper oxidase with cupredoxin domain
VGPDPEQIYDGLVAAGQENNPNGGMMHMGGMGMGSDHGDVNYSLYLINGRSTTDPDTLRVKPGDKVRLRIVNAAADSIFTFAVGGHTMTITHTDGYPVLPVQAQSLQLGMGERYDVVVTVGDGAFPVVAQPAGKSGYAMAVLRSAAGDIPVNPRPSELSAYPAGADILQAAPAVRLPRADPRTSYDLVFSGSMAPYVWTINGTTYDLAQPLTVQPGEPVRLRMSNMSMMSHPIHLHGHTFQIGPAGGNGARKDTLLLPPMARAEVNLVANNPGRWMLHCHNAYHAEAGMMTRLDYTT